MTCLPVSYHPENCADPAEKEEYFIEHRTGELKRKGEGQVYEYPSDGLWLGFRDRQSGADYVTADICSNDGGI